MIMSETRWPGYSMFAHLQPWKFIQKHEKFAKAGSKFCQILNNQTLTIAKDWKISKVAKFRPVWSHWLDNCTLESENELLNNT